MTIKEDTLTLRDEILQLAWPILFSGFLGTIIMFTDRLILGRYNPEALASMQVIGPVSWTAFSIFGSFGIGVLAIIGRATGAKDLKRAIGVLSSSVFVALVAGLLLGVVGILGKEWITDAMLGDQNPSETVRNMSTTYLTWTFGCAPFSTVAVILTFAFQASGDTKTPMWSSFFAGFVNLALSWIFVFGKFGAPELGIMGAAMGTAASAILNCLILAWFIQRPHQKLRISKPQWDMLPPVLKVSLPTLGERLIFHTGFLIFVGFVGRLGTVAMAAHQACMAIESLGFIASYAMGSACGTIVAQKLGAEKVEEAEEAIWFTMRFSVAFMCVVGCFFFVFAETLVGWFCTDPQSLALGISCMKIAAIAQPCMAFCDCFAGSLRGAGDTKSPMIAAIVGPVCVRVVMCYLLAFTLNLGLVGIWIGSTFDWASRGLWMFFVVKRGKWKSIEV